VNCDSPNIKRPLKSEYLWRNVAANTIAFILKVAALDVRKFVEFIRHCHARLLIFTECIDTGGKNWNAGGVIYEEFL
jgi:hypothetical protein